MSKRLTDTEKWNDAWFIELSRNEKLLFNYLIDKVDNAGFLEISFRKIMFDLEYSQDEILGAIKGLGRGLIFFQEGLKNGDVIYLKNFLKHQKNYPLNPFNPFHRHALVIFEERKNLIEKSQIISEFKVSGNCKKTEKKINTNLLNYLHKDKGLTSPIVEVEVKGKGKVEEKVKGKVSFEKSEKLLNIEVDSETIIEISEVENQIKNEFSWREQVCRNVKEISNSFSLKDFDNYLQTFFKTIKGDGETAKSIQDTKKHFNRWLIIQLKNGKQNNNNQQQGASDEFRAKTARRLGIV